jgi:prepilin-type N-terminal cleavage/methylation domain-containing protein
VVGTIFAIYYGFCQAREGQNIYRKSFVRTTNGPDQYPLLGYYHKNEAIRRLQLTNGRLQVKREFSILNQKGFTLIELISIMIILGVLGSVAIKKYDNLTDTANERVLATAVKELNVRESLIWSNMKISSDGYTNDADVYTALNTNFGSKLRWNPGPNIGGGTLHCESASCVLTRTPSTNTTAAKWN